MRPLVNVTEEDRGTDTGCMHKNGKDRACGSGDILADRQTHRQTHRQTYSSQYFATAPAGEVISLFYIKYKISSLKKNLSVVSHAADIDERQRYY